NPDIWPHRWDPGSGQPQGILPRGIDRGKRLAIPALCSSSLWSRTHLWPLLGGGPLVGPPFFLFLSFGDAFIHFGAVGHLVHGLGRKVIDGHHPTLLFSHHHERLLGFGRHGASGWTRGRRI